MASRWSWPAGRDLAQEQAALAAARPPAWQPGARVTVGASWCCFERGAGADTCSPSGPPEGERGWAAACRWAADGGGTLEVAVASGRAAAPYLPGRLAEREGALREAAVRRLEILPDVLLVNATGRDHPRGAGLASHLGAVLAVPTVGVTDRPLLAEGGPPSDRAGARSPLRLSGEVVGWWLRTRMSARPLAVHAAWRTTPQVAVEVVQGSLAGVRTPEPLRIARRAAREARAADRPDR